MSGVASPAAPSYSNPSGPTTIATTPGTAPASALRASRPSISPKRLIARAYASASRASRSNSASRAPATWPSASRGHSSVRPVPHELEVVAVGIGDVDRQVRAVVGDLAQRPVDRLQPPQRRPRARPASGSAARRGAGRPRRRAAAAAGGLPGVEAEVVVIAAGGEEQDVAGRAPAGHVARLEDHVEPEDADVEVADRGRCPPCAGARGRPWHAGVDRVRRAWRSARWSPAVRSSRAPVRSTHGRRCRRDRARARPPGAARPARRRPAAARRRRPASRRRGPTSVQWPRPTVPSGWAGMPLPAPDVEGHVVVVAAGGDEDRGRQIGHDVEAEHVAVEARRVLERRPRAGARGRRSGPSARRARTAPRRRRGEQRLRVERLGAAGVAAPRSSATRRGRGRPASSRPLPSGSGEVDRLVRAVVRRALDRGRVTAIRSGARASSSRVGTAARRGRGRRGGPAGRADRSSWSTSTSSPAGAERRLAAVAAVDAEPDHALVERERARPGR